MEPYVANLGVIGHPFHLYAADDMALLKDLERYFPENHNDVIQEYGQLSAYLLGKYEYCGVSIHVVPSNHEKPSGNDKLNTGYIYSFKSRKDYNYLMAMIKVKEFEKDQQLDSLYKHNVYRFSNEGKYQRKEPYHPRRKETLLGVDEVFHDIQNQLVAHTSNQKFLKEIGENGRSVNYLLYGPPGTGKSSFVTVVATEFQYPVYIVNPTTLAPEHLQAALSPPGSTPKILLYEDVDRYLGSFSSSSSSSGNNLPCLSQLLNSLDGMDDNNVHVIRFFTANNEQVLKDIPALASRFTATYHFDLPSKESLCTKVDILMKYYGDDWQQSMNQHQEMETLCDLAVQCKLSFRDLTNYVIRFLFPPLPRNKIDENGSPIREESYHPLQRCLDVKEWEAMMKMHAITTTTTTSPFNLSSSHLQRIKRRRRQSCSCSPECPESPEPEQEIILKPRNACSSDLSEVEVEEGDESEDGDYQEKHAARHSTLSQSEESEDYCESIC